MHSFQFVNIGLENQLSPKIAEQFSSLILILEARNKLIPDILKKGPQACRDSSGL